MLDYRSPPNPAVVGRMKKVDDESSIGSTLTVERANNTKLHGQASPQIHSKRASVRFNLARNVHFDTSPVFEDDMNDRWFCKADYKQMKENFIDVGRHFQNLSSSDPRSFKAVLCKAFDACVQAPTEDPRTCLLDRIHEDYLRKCLTQDARIGMERASVLSIFCDKSSRRKKLRKAIFGAQEAAAHQSPAERAELIREASREITRPSRLFAWRLAYKQAS